MLLNFVAVFTVVLLIFTNGLTDAPNAIATLVGSRVMRFRRAAFFSGVFNFFGVVVMSFVNFSVADCISAVVKLPGGSLGIVCLVSAMMSVILFALVALKFGIPTSETHALISGLTGSSLALFGFEVINWNSWNLIFLRTFVVGFGVFCSFVDCE